MTKNIVIASIILALIILVGGGLIPVFAMGAKPPQEEKGQPVQEYKTYVSKYGFSVSYPADWYLEEKKDIKLTQKELDGYISFTICDFNPDKPESSPGSKGIGVEFLFHDDAMSPLIAKGLKIPENKYEKLLYLSERHNIYIIDSKDTIKKTEINGIEIVLIYYEGKYPWQAIFYLPRQDAIVTVTTSEKSSSELIPILKTLKMKK